MAKAYHFKKRIYVDKRKKKFVVVLLFHNVKDLRTFYRQIRPKDKHIDETLGAHCGYVKVGVTKKGKEKYYPETGTMLLTATHCGAGLIAHEFLHALFWAHGHAIHKKQYPLRLTFQNINEEEAFCYQLTSVVRAFYTWFYRLERAGKIKIS